MAGVEARDMMRHRDKTAGGGNAVQKPHSRKPGGHGGGGSVKSYGCVLGELDRGGGGRLSAAIVRWMSREGGDARYFIGVKPSFYSHLGLRAGS